MEFNPMKAAAVGTKDWALNAATMSTNTIRQKVFGTIGGIMGGTLEKLFSLFVKTPLKLAGKAILATPMIIVPKI